MTTVPATIQERIVLPTYPGGVRGQEGTALSAGDLWVMLRRRAVLAIVLFLFLLSAFVGGFLIWWIYFPGFRSECLIECVSNVPSMGLTLEHERLRQEEHERFVSTQALLLKSPSILGEALKLNAVRETRWYKSVAEQKKEHLLVLTDELSASPVRGTNFLRVSFETRSKADPAIIVDAVVRLWLDTVRRRSADEFAADLQTTQAERESLDRRIEDKRRQLQAIATRMPPGVRQDPKDNPTAVHLRQLTEQAGILRLELSQLEQFRAVFNDPQALAVTTEDRVLVEQDPQVAELRRLLFVLEQQHAADLKKFGHGHQVLRSVESQIAATEEKLGGLENQRLTELQAKNRSDANTAFANTQYALFQVEEQLRQAEAALADQDSLQFQYSNIEAEIAEDADRRVQLNDYITNLERVVRQRGAISVNIAQPATDPLERSSPSRLLLPLSVFLAFALAAGVALGLELMDKSVRTTQDIGRYLDLPLLGVVPDTNDEEVAIQKVETAVRDAPRSMVAEGFRRIRTSLQFSAPAARQRTVVIASPRPNDGKSSVACNLAMAVAQGGRRVLLVDANLRRPELHGILGLSAPRGLSNILVGDGTLESCALASGMPLLDVLPGGPIPPNPAELLGGEPCRAFLQAAVSKYDQIIIDTAPVLVATDALVLGPVVDGVIIVVRAHETSRGIARRTCTLLSEVGAHFFGVVLNAAQVTRGGYFREQLRTYYEYQEEASGKTQ